MHKATILCPKNKQFLNCNSSSGSSAVNKISINSNEVRCIDLSRLEDVLRTTVYLQGREQINRQKCANLFIFFVVDYNNHNYTIYFTSNQTVISIIYPI